MSLALRTVIVCCAALIACAAPRRCPAQACGWFDRATGACGAPRAVGYAPTAAYYAPATVYRPVTAYRPVVPAAYTQTALYAPIAAPAAPAATICSYLPETHYRNAVVNMPVTVYRAVPSVDPCSGAAVSCLRPMTTYRPVIQGVPYTTYRIMNLAPVATTALYPQPAVSCAPTTSYAPAISAAPTACGAGTACGASAAYGAATSAPSLSAPPTTTYRLGEPTLGDYQYTPPSTSLAPAARGYGYAAPADTAPSGSYAAPPSTTYAPSPIAPEYSLGPSTSGGEAPRSTYGPSSGYAPSDSYAPSRTDGSSSTYGPSDTYAPSTVPPSDTAPTTRYPESTYAPREVNPSPTPARPTDAYDPPGGFAPTIRRAPTEARPEERPETGPLREIRPTPAAPRVEFPSQDQAPSLREAPASSSRDDALGAPQLVDPLDRTTARPQSTYSVLGRRFSKPADAEVAPREFELRGDAVEAGQRYRTIDRVNDVVAGYSVERPVVTGDDAAWRPSSR